MTRTQQKAALNNKKKLNFFRSKERSNERLSK